MWVKAMIFCSQSSVMSPSSLTSNPTSLGRAEQVLAFRDRVHLPQICRFIFLLLVVSPLTPFMWLSQESLMRQPWPSQYRDDSTSDQSQLRSSISVSNCSHIRRIRQSRGTYAFSIWASV